MKEYSAYRLGKMLDKSVQTVYSRFNSPYAKTRWGVVKEKRVDGSIKRYVPEDKIHLWIEDENYVGKPVFTNETDPE